MIYENYMIQTIVASDGDCTIGYIDGRPAIWEGNTNTLQEGDNFDFCNEDYVFGIDYDDQYRVIDDEWQEQN